MKVELTKEQAQHIQQCMQGAKDQCLEGIKETFVPKEEIEMVLNFASTCANIESIMGNAILLHDNP